MKSQVRWHDLNMLPLYLAMSQDQLENTREQLVNLEACKDRPHVLDDVTINRVIKLHTERNEYIEIFIEQCNKWRKQNPSKKQLDAIERIEHNTKVMEEVNKKVLFLAGNLKNYTIDRILAKNDVELFLDFIQGNLPAFKTTN